MTKISNFTNEENTRYVLGHLMTSQLQNQFHYIDQLRVDLGSIFLLKIALGIFAIDICMIVFLYRQTKEETTASSTINVQHKRNIFSVMVLNLTKRSD